MSPLPTRAERATGLRRLGGLLIDALVLAVPQHLLSRGAIAGLLALAYTIGCIAVWQRTIGERLVRVRVAHLDPAETRSWFATAAIRALFVSLPGLAVTVIRPHIGRPELVVAELLAAAWVLFVLLPVFGEDRRGRHDRAAGTIVVLDD